MSCSDHNRSRSPRGYIALKRQRIRATRHLARASCAPASPTSRP